MSTKEDDFGSGALMQALGRTEREEASGPSTVPSAVWQWLNPNNSSLAASSDTLPKRGRSSKKDDAAAAAAAGTGATASRKRKTAKYADEREGTSNATQDNEAICRRSGRRLNGKGKIKDEEQSEEAKLNEEDENDEDFPQPSEPKPLICSCKKSRCLKLYCVCFSGQIFCSEKCICSYCANTLSFVNLRNKKRDAIIARKPNAFVSKYGTMQGPAANTNEAKEVGAGAGASGSSSPRNAPVAAASSSSSASSPAGAQVAHLYGCHCKRSRCLYKYCECFYGRVRCTQACSCLDCQNFKTVAGGVINPKDMQLIMDMRAKEREEKKMSLAKAAAEPGQNGLAKSRAYDRGTFDQFCLTNEAFVVAAKKNCLMFPPGTAVRFKETVDRLAWKRGKVIEYSFDSKNVKIEFGFKDVLSTAKDRRSYAQEWFWNAAELIEHDRVVSEAAAVLAGVGVGVGVKSGVDFTDDVVYEEERSLNMLGPDQHPPPPVPPVPPPQSSFFTSYAASAAIRINDGDDDDNEDDNNEWGEEN